jgi:hypothetical protein
VAEKTGELALRSGVVALLASGFLLGIFPQTGCAGSPEAKLRAILAKQTTGIIRLPTGVIEISSELLLAPGAHDLEIAGSGTLLKAHDDFKGRAILVAEGAKRIRLHDFSVDGNRPALEKPLELAPPENAFRIWYPNNGILFDQTEGIEIADVHFSAVTNFPVLISRSSGIRIHGVVIEDSGSLNGRRRNNTTGGILLEEGASDFEVRDCSFRRIYGNGLWTHSLFTSPRAQNGMLLRNRFDIIGRDAIEVAHATNVRVQENTGEHIGFPPEVVDVENGGTPVGIDTAGNVDRSEYRSNRFEEINGKCIDLDGFHDGAVRENHCVNRRPPAEYPSGHFGIVLNNTDPNMHSRNIEITGNEIDGTKFGGLFVLGSGHRITGNILRHLNTSGCNENARQFGCVYKPDEPQMLEAGIYLGRGVARAEETRDNIIRDNQISGHKMQTRCVIAGPGVSLAQNSVSGNTCSDYKPGR